MPFKKLRDFIYFFIFPDRLNHPRYRQENGVYCIDLNLKNERQLFDGRDPAPFHERDLDDDAAEYLLSSVREFHWYAPLKIVLTLQNPWPEEDKNAFKNSEPNFSGLDEKALIQAIHIYFEYEAHKKQLQIHSLLRQVPLYLWVGLLTLFGCLYLAYFLSENKAFFYAEYLSEGLRVVGWVALWKPIQVLLYDWQPLWRERRYLKKLAKIDISILRPGLKSEIFDAS